MKKEFLKFPFILLCSSFLLFIGCTQKENFPDIDGLDPIINLDSDHIHTAAGYTATISGLLEDADGIATIRLVCPALYLDKTIDILEIYGKPLDSYKLEYNYNIAKNEIGEIFTVKIIVTDIGGRITEKDATIALDKDFVAPIFTSAPDKTLSVLMKSETKFKLRFSIKDDKALSYVIIKMDGVPEYENKRIELDGNTEYNFCETITLPSTIKEWPIHITVYDAQNNTSETTCTVCVSEMPDFPKMYLADVKTTEELNNDIFGVPMVIEHIGKYTYKANYYCSKKGTEIRFIPQKSDFSPICFGIDPSNNAKIIEGSDEVAPIILDEAGVYYEITFDIMNGTWSKKTYSIKDAIDPIPHKFGSMEMDQWENGEDFREFYFGYTTSGPKHVSRFIQDELNPHLFRSEAIELEAGSNMNFIIHNYHSNGWWNYCTWRVDDSYEPEKFGYYGKRKNPAWTKENWVPDNWAKPAVNVSGKYILTFDAHLERATLIPEK